MDRNQVPGRSGGRSPGRRQADRQNKGKNNPRSKVIRNRVILVCIAVLIVLGGIFCYLGASAFDQSVIGQGVLIEGQDVSGKTKQEVIDLLNAMENPYMDTAVTAKMDDSDHTLVVDAASIDLKVDSEATAQAAFDYGKGNIFQSFYAKVAKKDFAYIPSYDLLKLDNMINRFAVEVGGTLKQHEIRDEETQVVVHAGEAGLGVDLAAAREKILSVLKPHLQQEVTLTKENTDPSPIDLDYLYESTRRDAVDARYEIQDNDVIIAPEVNGREINKEEAARLLQGFKPGSPDVTIPFVMHEAAVKAADLSSNLFADTLGSFSTKYMTSNVSRASNVALSAKNINGTILLPGDTFSYNDVVGPRTAARGFKEASIYENNKMVDGLGGGICQTSSTLYAAVLYADLEVIERHEHSLEVTYAPLGMDATVAYGSLDFRFRNNTDAPLKVQANASGGVVTVSIVGTNPHKNRTIKITTETVSTTPIGVTEIKDSSLPAGKTVVDSPGFKGHVVNTYKVIYEDGKQIENKFLHKSVYTMANKVIRVGTGSTTPASVTTQPPVTESPTPSPTPTETATSTPTPTISAIPTEEPSMPENTSYPEGL